MKNSNQLFSGKIAIVTGASAGYGLGIATRLVQAGCTVYATGRNEETLKEACKKTKAIPVTANASCADDWQRLTAQVIEENGKIDLLVNNAGSGGKIGPFHELTTDEASSVIGSNLLSVILGSHAVVPHMVREKSGSVINVSSVCAHYSWPGWAVYSAAKAGVERFTKSFYAEYRDQGVRATTLTPSWGVTNFVEASAITGHPSQQAEVQAQCTKPEELGDAVVHLFSTPAHLNILDYTIIPTVQAIEPL